MLSNLKAMGSMILKNALTLSSIFLVKIFIEKLKNPMLKWQMQVVSLIVKQVLKLGLNISLEMKVWLLIYSMVNINQL
jgi:hypothetical protein